MKVYDWIAGVVVFICVVWGVVETATETKKKTEAARIENQKRRIAQALAPRKFTELEKKQIEQNHLYSIAKGKEWEEQQRAKDKKWVEDILEEQKRREVVERNLKIYRETGYYPSSGSVGWYGYSRRVVNQADEDDDSDEVPVTRASGYYQARITSYDDDDSFDTSWTSRRASYARRQQAEQEAQMDDYLGAINPREGLAVKVGGMAFRGNDVAINTGGGVTIEGSRAWIDTGSTIIKPDGGAIIRSGGMYFDDQGLRAQQIGGRGGDYINRRGYSVNQDGMMLTSP